MNNFFVRFRIYLLILTLVGGAVCGLMIPRVNINTDMTKYLPNKSQMRKGLEIINEEFGDKTEMSTPDVRVMFSGLSEQQKKETLERLKAEPEVTSVRVSEKDVYTLYEMGVIKTIDQREFGAQIKENYDRVNVVETSHDGSAADTTMLIIAVVLLLTILFIMCKSWTEPVLFILSTGVAVLINLGSNALLESVSMTTNSIVAVLQLVLSMDYSIILANRYRQEKANFENKFDAMGEAVKKATPSVLSSAATTIVGLLVLVFMKLKIGEDLGVVLAKGVACSLLCNYTVLPTLLLGCDKLIGKTGKPTPHIATDKLANFSVKFRIPLAILFVGLIAGAYILHNKTVIRFSTNGVSQIDKIFPKKNITVVMYDTKDEMKLPGMVDELMQDSGVELVISYPSILLRQYTTEQMIEAIKELQNLQKAQGGEVDSSMTASTEMLTDPMMKLVYYASHTAGETKAFNFNEMANFVIEQSKDSTSLLSGKLDDDLRTKLDMFHEIMEMNEMAAEEAKAAKAHKTTKKEDKPVEQAVVADVVDAQADSSKIEETTVITGYNKYTDVSLLTKPMGYEEMAEYLGMESGHARLVYKMWGKKKSMMTPIQFVHYVLDDLFNRKLVSAMAKDEEKAELRRLVVIMDNALAHPGETVAEIVAEDNGQTAVHHAVAQDSVVPVAMPSLSMKGSSAAIRRLNNMFNAVKEYTSAELQDIVKGFGEELDPWMVDLLYLYYGSYKDYDSTWTMSLEQMVVFIADTILADQRFDAFIDDGVRDDFGNMKEQMVSQFSMMRGDEHSLAVVISDCKDESPETYAFMDKLDKMCKSRLGEDNYCFVGESAMFTEMRNGFDQEMKQLTWLTIIVIFLIVALTFRSLIIPTILVMTIMTAVFVNVAFSGVGGNTLLYLAYLIVQSILMGATIDYGILFTNCYKESRQAMDVKEAVGAAYKSSIATIMTSGLIMIIAPAVLAMTITDVTISDILQSISIGALAAVLLILFVLPGMLVLTDRLIIRKKKEK